VRSKVKLRLFESGGEFSALVESLLRLASRTEVNHRTRFSWAA
jgi:hypothetical protein